MRRPESSIESQRGTTGIRPIAPNAASRAAGPLVAVERSIAVVPAEDGGERLTQRDGVLDPGVHSLSASGCAVAIGQSVVNRNQCRRRHQIMTICPTEFRRTHRATCSTSSRVPRATHPRVQSAQTVA